jgi:diadenosine tetraphosphate (Ap4A) HIT family hydrolase
MGFYHFENSRGGEQLAEMRRLDAAGICLFCPGHLEDVQEVVHRSAHWTVTPNRFPYPNTALHLLLVPHAHVTDLVDLPAPAQTDLFATLAWAKQTYDLTYYALGARCGDLPCTGATIKHLHLHVIVGDLTQEPVKFTMSRPPRS